MNYGINLVFHGICESEKQIESRYSVSLSFFKAFIAALRQFLAAQQLIQQVRFYFDDNLISCFRFALPMIGGTPFNGVAAVTVDSIGQSGHCSLEQIRILHKHGFDILPHGFSHTALCVYRNETLQATPAGGLYRSMAAGKKNLLTEQEVLFQMVESKKSLTEFSPDEFVLPYGLYNDQTISINCDHKVYRRIATCDCFLDAGELLRPRLLITSDVSIGQIMHKIRDLLPRPGESN